MANSAMANSKESMLAGYTGLNGQWSLNRSSGQNSELAVIVKLNKA